MSIINYFKRKKSASTAKDRLQIVIAQQRSQKDSQDFLPLLRQDIIAAISKHMKIDAAAVQVDLHNKDNNAILELNVILPETHPEALAAQEDTA